MIGKMIDKVMYGRYRDVWILSAGLILGVSLTTTLYSAVGKRMEPVPYTMDSKVDMHTFFYDLRTGDLETVMRWRSGRLHSDKTPAFVEYRGEVPIFEKWYESGRLHRMNGPAVIKRDNRTGEIMEIQWWENGRQYEPRQEFVMQWLTQEILSKAK